MKLSGIQKLVCDAVKKYGLFMSGSKIIVGISGGKDSMTLLSLLAALRNELDFSICAAVYVMGSYDMVPVRLPDDIKEFIDGFGIELIEVLPDCSCSEPLPMSCYRCSAVRRKTLLEKANELGADTVALAHTRDDAAETVLKELLKTGKMGSFLPKRIYFGKISVVRPMILVPSHAVEAYVKNHHIPVYNGLCPLAGTTERAAARRLLQECTRYFPEAVRNLADAGGICKQ